MTPGQKRVREIVDSFKCQHNGVWRRGCEESNSFYRSFLKRIRSCQIIQNDRVTGRGLNDTIYSLSYINWVKANSREVDMCSNFPPINLNNFKYNRPFSCQKSAYLGGDKYQTTYSCLFSIIKNIPIISHGWDLFYINEICYSSVISGGNHRSLAFMLTGEEDIAPERLVIYENPALDSSLNSSFLNIEKITSNFGKIWIPDYKDKKEIELVKVIDQALNIENTLVLSKFLERELMCGLSNTQLTPKGLFEIISKIDIVISDHNRISSSVIRKVSNFFSNKKKDRDYLYIENILKSLK